jgi:hypothetical protein
LDRTYELRFWSGFFHVHVSVFAGEDLDMYATIPVHPDLWLQSVFTDGQSGVAQIRTEYFSGFPVQAVDWPRSDGSSSKIGLATSL